MLGRECLLLHSEEAILHKPSSIDSGRQLDHICCIAMHMLSSRPISLNMCSHMRRVCLSAPAALIKYSLTQEDQDITLPLTLILVQPNINTEQNRQNTSETRSIGNYLQWIPHPSRQRNRSTCLPYPSRQMVLRA